MQLIESEVIKVANMLSTMGKFIILQEAINRPTTNIYNEKINQVIGHRYYPCVRVTAPVPITRFIYDRVGGQLHSFRSIHRWELRQTEAVHDLLTAIHPYSQGNYRLRLTTLARYIQNRPRFITRGFGHRQYHLLLNEMDSGDYSKYSTAIEADPLIWEDRHIETTNPVFAVTTYSRYNLPEEL